MAKERVIYRNGLRVTQRKVFLFGWTNWKLEPDERDLDARTLFAQENPAARPKDWFNATEALRNNYRRAAGRRPIT